jgi:hypothetical protein
MDAGTGTDASTVNPGVGGVGVVGGTGVVGVEGVMGVEGPSPPQALSTSALSRAPRGIMSPRGERMRSRPLDIEDMARRHRNTKEPTVLL